MLFCCPWLLCQAGATYAAKRAALRAALGASIRQPGSSKGSTVAIASMPDASIHSARVLRGTCPTLSRRIRDSREAFEASAAAEPPKATQKEWL